MTDDSDRLQRAVMKELKTVRFVGFTKLELPQDKTNRRNDPTPILDEAARRSPVYEPGFTRSSSIAALLRYEISRLSDLVPFKKWLPVLLGLSDKEEHQKLSTGELRREAARLAGEPDVQNFTRRLQKIGLEGLAAQIVADLQQSAADGMSIDSAKAQDSNPVDLTRVPGSLEQSEPWQQDANADGLIERHEYMERISALVADGARLIALTGEPGTGKSVLAASAARWLNPKRPVVTLHVGDKDILKGDVLKALRLSGLQPETWTDAACQVALQDELRTSASLGGVIVDDVTDETEALVWNLLIPDLPRVPIIFTSRKKLQGRDPQQLANISFVELGEFSEEEADLLIEQALPDCDELERHDLIAVLGRRPLMLSHAMQFLSQSLLVQPGDIIAAFTGDVSHGLNLIEPTAGSTPKLVQLYQMMLEELTVDDAARDALDIFLISTGSSALCESGLLTFAMRVVFPAPAYKVRLQAGCNALARWGLIRFEKTQWSGVYEMHALTRRVLLELRTSITRRLAPIYLDALSDTEVIAEDMQRPKIRLIHETLRLSSDLLPGWKWVHCVDRGTWFACMETTDLGGATSCSHFRYDILPNAIMRFDYSTGESVPPARQEMREFYRIVTYYDMVVGLWLGEVMTTEDDVPLLYTDGPDFAIQVLRLSLDRDDVDLLWEIACMGRHSPAPFFRLETEFRQLLEDVSVRLRQLDEAYSLAELDELHRSGMVGLARNRFYQQMQRMYRFVAEIDRWLPEELVLYTRWLVDDGEASEAAAGLAELERRTGPGLRTLTARQAAETAATGARINCAQGDWTLAIENLEASLSYFNRCEEGPLVAVQGIVYVQMVMLDVLLMSGASGDELHRLEVNVNATWAQRPEDFSDKLAEARKVRISTRLAIARIARKLWWDVRDGAVPTPPRLPSGDRHLEQLYSQVEETFVAAYNLHPEQGEFAPDAFLLMALMGRVDGLAIVKVSESREPWLNCGLWRPLHLTGRKVALVLGEREANCYPTRQFHFYHKIVPGTMITGQVESAYWYAESLAVACVVGAQWGFSYQPAWQTLQKEYERLGRMDRLEELGLALAALPNDYDEFVRHFAYLLTW